MTSGGAARWILAAGLGVACVAQAVAVRDAAFLDSDDWFIVRMGRETLMPPADEPPPLLRFWSDEPTWRPGLTLLAAAEQGLVGAAALPRVIWNLLLHLLAGVLLFLCVRRWSGQPVMAAWAAVLFACHPLHAETLAWFHSGFEGIPVTVAVLVTLWLHLRRAPLWAGLVAFQAALLLRENAVMVPLLIALLGGWRRAIPYGVLLGVNIAARPLHAYLLGGGAGSFHLTDHPVQALLSAAGHPWFPLHPALPARGVLLATFAVLLGALILLQRGRDRRWLAAAAVAYAVACLPFLPQFHAGTRFLQAAPGGIEQRWYFFHLPLAAWVIWPAGLLAGRRWAPAALAALLLAVQILNIGWWMDRCRVARDVTATVGRTLESGERAVGLVYREGSDDAEIADKVFLEAREAFPNQAAGGLRAFHRRNGRVEEATRGHRGQPVWKPPRAPVEGARWWRWDDDAGRLVRLP